MVGVTGKVCGVNVDVRVWVWVGVRSECGCEW